MTAYTERPLIFGKTIKVDDRCIVAIGKNWGQGIVYGRPALEFFFDKAKDIKDPVIFDVGANIGAFSMISKFLDKSKIYAFEPQPNIYDILKSNMIINELDRVFCHNIALSNVTGETKMSVPTRKDFSGLGTLSLNPLRFSNKDVIDIKCDTLDNFCNCNHIEKIDLMKIDTEGYEYNILLGGMETIKKFKPKILMEFAPENIKQCGIVPSQIISLLKTIGYKYEEHPIGEEDIFCEYVEKG